MDNGDGSYGQSGFHLASQRPVSASRHTSPELPLDPEEIGLVNTAGYSNGHLNHIGNDTNGPGSLAAVDTSSFIDMSAPFFNSNKSVGSPYQQQPHPHQIQHQVQQHFALPIRHAQSGYHSPYLVGPSGFMQQGLISNSPSSSNFMDPALSTFSKMGNGMVVQDTVVDINLDKEAEDDEEDNEDEEDNDEEDDDDDDNSSEYSNNNTNKKRRRGLQSKNLNHALRGAVKKRVKSQQEFSATATAGSSGPTNGARRGKAKSDSYHVNNLLDLDGKSKSSRGSKACTVCRRLKMRCEPTGFDADTKCKRCKAGGHDVSQNLPIRYTISIFSPF